MSHGGSGYGFSGVTGALGSWTCARRSSFHGATDLRPFPLNGATPAIVFRYDDPSGGQESALAQAPLLA